MPKRLRLVLFFRVRQGEEDRLMLEEADDDDDVSVVSLSMAEDAVALANIRPTVS